MPSIDWCLQEYAKQFKSQDALENALLPQNFAPNLKVILTFAVPDLFYETLLVSWHRGLARCTRENDRPAADPSKKSLFTRRPRANSHTQSYSKDGALHWRKLNIYKALWGGGWWDTLNTPATDHSDEYL